jgi:hypothetical protein
MLDSRRILSFLTFFGLWFVSCVESFKLPQDTANRILTVDARITDEPIEQTVTIYESISQGVAVYTAPVERAKVELVVNNQERIALSEKAKGVYVLPASFKFQYNTPYKLVFQKSDGTSYESDNDAVTKVPPIDKITESFRVKGEKMGSVDVPTHYLSIDTRDPADAKNNYIWSWRFWEKIEICETCYSGRLRTTPQPDVCITIDGLFGQFFDYKCPGDCWNIYHNTNLNTLQDTFINGKPILNKEVVQVPLYQPQGVLIEFKHQNVSEESYRYLKLLIEQTQNTGSLTDAPPAAIVGNIRNVKNPQEDIAGSFMVLSSITTKYWLTRASAIAPAQPIGLQGTRPLNVQTSPTARCYESRNRTAIRPVGWR